MEKKQILYNALKDVPEEAWENLSQKKIYFGHQSVGFNIMDGVNDLMEENPQIRLRIVKTRNIEDFGNNIFGHSEIGKNLDPKSKIKDFQQVIENDLGNVVDIAFFKFCYVDFDTKTKLSEIFENYRKTMKDLQDNYPDTKFIHATIPISSDPEGLKSWIKKAKDLLKGILGRANMYDNGIKKIYNDMLRDQYLGKEPVLDIEAIESTFPDGTRREFTKNGKTYYSMVPAYTNDGGHLNKAGRKKVAEQLLLLLVNLN